MNEAKKLPLRKIVKLSPEQFKKFKKLLKEFGRMEDAASAMNLHPATLWRIRELGRGQEDNIGKILEFMCRKNLITLPQNENHANNATSAAQPAER